MFSSPHCEYHWYDPTTKELSCVRDCLDIMSYNDFDRSALIKNHFVVSFHYPILRITKLDTHNITTKSTGRLLVSRRNFGFGLFDHYFYAVSCTYYK